LVGEPYRFNVEAVVSDDEPVQVHATGVLEKVRLPDGSMFIAAGRVDVLATDVEIIIEPDSGVLRNQEAFCAALSG
jgi:hypothetical protein